MSNSSSINKMAEMPVNKLILNISIPIIISMVLQSVYNIVDSYFVSHMSEHGEDALNALTLAFPVQVFMVAVGIGTGVGVNALLSKSLGEGDSEKAGKVAGNGIFLACCITVLFILFGVFGTKVYVNSQTENPLIQEMAINYIQICCIGGIGMHFFSVFEKQLQATGLSLYSTIAMISGAVTNIVLDPIMIYGLLGVPEMGVKGAAWATILGQILSAVLGLIFHIWKNKAIPKKLSYIKPDGRIIKQIYSIGFPAIVAQALLSVMTYCLNLLLVKIGEPPVTAYGLYYKIQQFVLFAAFGMRDTITPVISYNYGFGSKKRVNAGIKYGIIYTTVIMLVGTLLVEILAGPFSSIFHLSGETSQIFLWAMRIITLSYIFAGFNICFQGIYQALNAGLFSLIISVLRQFVLVIPVVLGLVYAIHFDSSKTWVVWFAFLFAEGVSALIGLFLLKNVKKTRVAGLK